ncbi:hypothetical protein F5051DRAFT_456819 [Lentinula edodes]|nr:hypothetical protein F5051DRAFT_456819 [Lentinula edodes]
MGKWTSGYYDDVLSSKIKSLVSGAIKRSKLDKTEPEINFERFVEELDAGDSFTTSIFDILVNELADRQSRSNVDDRRLIGERTARSLRIITTSNKVYFSSSFSHRVTGRSRSHIYYPGPPEDIDLEEDEEEDEFSALLDTDTTLRQQHDAMMETAGASSVLPSFAARSSSPAPIAPTDEVSAYSRSWVPPHSYLQSGSSLSRSSSLRRPARSRTVDFNDFTSRRRSTIRNTTSGATSSANTDATSNTASESRDRDSNSWLSPGATRRFFGLSRPRRSNPELNLWSDLPDGDDGLTIGDNTTVPYLPASSSSHGVILPPLSEAEISGERSTTSIPGSNSNPTFPRLRRGSLRRPESLLSRQASPAETVVIPDDYDSSRRAPSPPDISEYIVESFDRPRFGRGTFSSLPILIPEGGSEGGATYGTIETAAYPTPGSTVDN